MNYKRNRWILVVIPTKLRYGYGWVAVTAILCVGGC